MHNHHHHYHQPSQARSFIGFLFILMGLIFLVYVAFHLMYWIVITIIGWKCLTFGMRLCGMPSMRVLAARLFF